jgi:hypothetical protein
MGKRFFDLARTDLGKEQSYALDDGAGTATAHMRIVWYNGTNARYLDIATESPTAIDPGRMSEAALTVAGTVTDILRVNYEDTHGPDRILGGMRAIREEIELRGRAAGWLGSAQNGDDIIALLRSAEFAFGARCRHENHCAANSPIVA